MKILIIGGTGTMGEPLTEFLSSNKENTVYVVARKMKIFSNGNVTFLQGNVYDFGFFVRTVVQGYDVIIDFMAWKPKELKKRLDIIFNSCKQYIALGSSAEYAKAEGMIEEISPRLIDGYSSEEKKQMHRYHIKKSVDVDIIMKSQYRHWTIVRPSLTFNKQKITWLGYSKEIWLWRYLHDQTIVIPKEVMDKRTTLTYGGDVASAIVRLVGNRRALGEVINVASDISITQGELLKVFQKILSELCKKELKVRFISNSSAIWKNIPAQYDIYIKDRCIDRCFSTEKLNEICGRKIAFGDLYKNLRMCMEQFLNELSDEINPPSPEFSGLLDRLTKEYTPLKTFSGKKAKLKYLIFRSALLSWAFRVYRFVKNDKYRYIYKKG